MEEEVCVVIAAFRPERSLLHLAQEIQAEESIVAVVDDGSPCAYDDIFRSLPENVIVRRHARNAGIARSLNEGLHIATKRSVPWLLTLDQDSTPGTEMLTTLLTATRRRAGAAVGAIAPGTVRIAGQCLSYPITPRHGLLTTHEVLQSGTLWNVAALNEVGGFDEGLCMDAVDAGACLALRQQDYVIGVCPEAEIDHHWGDARWIRAFGRDIAVTNHSSERRTTMVRNRLRLAPAEFRQSPVHAFRTLRRVAVSSALAVTVESHPWNKAKAAMRGVWQARGR